MTFNQLIKCVREEKKRKVRSPRMEKKPQRKCICMKVTTVKPKKPNSAIRKIAKVALVNKFRVIKKQKFTIAYIPGIGHNLRQHSVILLRGGRVPDLPGVKYHIIRGKYDFTGIEKFARSTRRSKFSVKNLKKV